MKRLLFLLAIMLMAAPAMADYYVAGDFNGWNASGNAMTMIDNGVWQVNLTGVSSRHEFKITDGSWNQNWPGSGNSWFYGDANGNVTITWDTNIYSDGWSGDGTRIGISADDGAWTAVGDWQGWNNTDSTTAMTSLGNGLYYFEKELAAGWYQYKAVKTGTWDAIGADTRSINANTWWFETTAGAPLAKFWLNANSGAIKVETSAVPEPAGLLVLAAGLPFGMFFRKRR